MENDLMSLDGSVSPIPIETELISPTEEAFSVLSEKVMSADDRNATLFMPFKNVGS